MLLPAAVRDGDTVRLRLTCAGHLPPLVVRAGGEVEEAPTRGTLVGVLPEVKATTARMTLAPGETCLLYTDGVTEARGGPFGDVMFGEDRLRAAFAECAGMPAEPWSSGCGCWPSSGSARPARRHDRARDHRAARAGRMTADSLTGVRPAGHYVDQLGTAVEAGNEATTREVVSRALADGLDRESVLLDVIGAVQRRVGQERAAGRITVAQEHAATAINDRAIAGLPVSPRPAGARVGHVTVACVDGEWHALPARLLAEVLALRRFEVDYLGAHVPGPHLIAHLHRTAPAAVALSSSIATRLPTAHATITACQAAGVPVIAGGAAFGADGRYARLLGAEAWAPDARAAADRLAADPLPRPRPGHDPIDDLPHLADQEYTMVSRSAPLLVKAMYGGLEERVPAMREYTEPQRQYTAEDLRHIVDFLATALYTGDAELFTGFLSWTAGILEVRQVPAGTLLPTVELLAAELRDFPRAVALLASARTHLESYPGKTAWHPR